MIVTRLTLTLKSGQRIGLVIGYALMANYKPILSSQVLQNIICFHYKIEFV
jgi:hypothetical protein